MMNNMFTTDNLAIYAAIVSTVAIFLNFLKFKHDMQKEKIQLIIDFSKVPNFEEKIKIPFIPYDPVTGGGSSPGQLFTIIIRNTGSIDAQLESVYGISQKGDVINADKPYWAKTNLYFDRIPAKTSKTYSFSSQEKHPVFELKKCIAVDSFGKKWERQNKS